MTINIATSKVCVYIVHISFQVHQIIYVGRASFIPLLFLLLTEKGSALMNFWLNIFTIGKELGLQNKRFIIGEK